MIMRTLNAIILICALNIQLRRPRQRSRPSSVFMCRCRCPWLLPSQGFTKTTHASAAVCMFVTGAVDSCGFGLISFHAHCTAVQSPSEVPAKLTTINITEFRQLWADAQMLDELLPPKRIVEIFQNE